MTITDFVELFSTREQAFAILSFAVVVLLTAFKTSRKPLVYFIQEVSKILPRLWLIFLLTGIHVWLVYTSLKMAGLWSYRLIDELVVFYLIAIGLIFRACKEDFLNFRKEVSSLFIGTIFLSAILDKGTFPLTTELILIPVITFLTLMEFYAKDQQSKAVIKKALAFFGWAAFLYAFYFIGIELVAGNYEPIYEAALSIALPISFVPMLYIIFLIMEYEVLFQAIGRKSMLNNKYRQKLKIGVVLYCLANPKKVRRMRANLFLIDYNELTPIEAAKFLSLSNDFDTMDMSHY